MVEDWRMALHIGMGKASACRMILEVVCEMSMCIQAPNGIVGMLRTKACVSN